MARATAAQVAAWVTQAGFTQPTAAIVTAIGLVNPDLNRPGGIFGTSGPAGDGPGQAKAAHDAWQAHGLAAFTGYTTGQWQLFKPTADAAVKTAPTPATLTAATIPLPNPADPSQIAIQGGTLGLNIAGGLHGWTVHELQRATKIGLGIILISIAAIQLTRATVTRPVNRKVEKILGNVDEGVQKTYPTTTPNARH